MCFKKVVGDLSLTFVNMYEITNLGAKVGQPVAYPSHEGGATAYRLEIPHPDGSGEMMRALINHRAKEWSIITSPVAAAFVSAIFRYRQLLSRFV